MQALCRHLTRAGYTYRLEHGRGWEERLSESTTVGSDITMYAQWRRIIAVVMTNPAVETMSRAVETMSRAAETTNPAAVDNEPGGGDDEPGGGDDEPGGGDDEPGGGDDEPGGGDNEPGSGDNEPGGSSGSQPDTPGTGTTGDNQLRHQHQETRPPQRPAAASTDGSAKDCKGYTAATE